MEIVIEKGIAMPQTDRGVNGKTRFPFDKMDVGDSFFIDGDSAKANSVRASATHYKNKYDKNFSVSIIKDGNGYRLFRIK